MKPSQIFKERRSDILAIASKYRVRNVRVFGSVLHDEDTEGSDIDLLVDALPGVTLFHLGGLQDELQTALGVKVDLLTPLDLPEAFRQTVLAEAIVV
jgi:uncharacterized protein